MKIKKHFLFLLLILAIASILRLWQLGVNPPSLDWDEASLGYNAYSILKTGADEYGNFLPTSIRSFNDYKPAAYVYLTIPSVFIFGLNEFAVRLPSAALGILTVLFTYLLVKELFKAKNLQFAEAAALVSALLLAISPWHLQFSRSAFEGNVGVFFFVGGIYFLLKALNKGLFFAPAFIFFVLTFYSYHSFRLVTPLFLLFSIFYFRKEILEKKKHFLVSALFALILTLPLLLSIFTNLARFSSVTIFNSSGILDTSIKQLELDRERENVLGEIFHNRRVVYAQNILDGYLSHFDPVFLFLRGDSVERHHAIGMGMLYIIELPFLLVGIFYLSRKKDTGRLILLIWLLAAPAAASLATGTPHAIRAIAMIPVLQVITAIGIVAFYEWNKKAKLGKFIIFTFSALFLLNALYYLDMYYVHTPIENSKYWQYGYRQVFEYAKERQDKYDKIIVTYKYDQPYIYYLFFNKIEPSWYQKNWDYNNDGEIERMTRIIGKYEFRNIDYAVDSKAKNVLLIGTPDEISQNASIKEINFLDGTVAFRIAES
ncbi:MAG: hypothetical protein A2798_01830 [Candidatus Levybacteria bacterium RIFCSPHIGHO2_01_FULL_37_17]|nr:MAG: hypothetical protein A2798_01830 [Candidatus Levybacteria bacterium RIFCSPHIGHO2_01_FULL_37_17]OGH37187.1 MAG: hypothetical protein A2959_02690 [Candidatus Levybacteria bacterium RIFCSPLOWO2_01_FULL_38_23]